MRALLSALLGGWPVIVGRAERACAPGRWVVWRDADGLHIEVTEFPE